MPLRLAIFDLDGTLKQAHDPYVYLHHGLGTWEACQAFTGQGLAGALDYDEWLRLDAALWKGVRRERIEELFRQNPYLPGAWETVAALKQAGVRVAVVSTGISVHAELVQRDLGLDRVYANELLFLDGVATGEALCRVREGGKGEIVAELQAEFGLFPEDCLAVGDGSSDADMFARVRFGVAVAPSSERARAAASLVIEEADLSGLLPVLRRLDSGWLVGML